MLTAPCALWTPTRSHYVATGTATRIGNVMVPRRKGVLFCDDAAAEGAKARARKRDVHGDAKRGGATAAAGTEEGITVDDDSRGFGLVEEEGSVEEEPPCAAAPPCNMVVLDGANLAWTYSAALYSVLGCRQKLPLSRGVTLALDHAEWERRDLEPVAFIPSTYVEGPLHGLAVGAVQLDPTLKALGFQILESATLSSHCFQIPTCAPTSRMAATWERSSLATWSIWATACGAITAITVGGR